MIGRINQLLAEELAEDERFVAATFGCVQGRRLEVCSAGQSCCLWLPSRREVETSGPPLGLCPENVYATRELELSPGDLVAFFTDGLPDWRNQQGECFGEERLASALERWGLDTTQIYEEARQFARGRAQSDDVTLLILQRAHSGP
jgi:serine phosphatase RsbU (regulator of sigma subunit)